MRTLLKRCRVIAVMVIQMIRSYKELSRLETFEERFNYLKLNGRVGKETFGFDRVFNQAFYTSPKWRSIRNQIIVRDNGCDLGIEGYEINYVVVNDKIIRPRIFIHHMNPISLDDIENNTEFLMNPDYLITTTFATHQAIHYGDVSLLATSPIERRRNDTCPWKN